jgi:sugar/nucleoside kinase (ribokinase family)
LLEKTAAGALLVKFGAEGILVLAPEPEFATGSLPAMNSNPVDVAGAGDALLAAAGLTLAAGGSTWECAYLGSVAAAIAQSAAQVAAAGDLKAIARAGYAGRVGAQRGLRISPRILRTRLATGTAAVWPSHPAPPKGICAEGEARLAPN